jgi:hypothetical protein
MKIEDVYKKLNFEGKGGFVSLAEPDWNAKVKLPARVQSLLKDKSSPLSEASALF